MIDTPAPSIDIPAAISPADAEAFRTQMLSTLERAKGGAIGVALDVDQPNLAPVSLQLLIATKRTAETLGIALEMSEECQGVLIDLQLN